MSTRFKHTVLAAAIGSALFALQAPAAAALITYSYQGEVTNVRTCTDLGVCASDPYDAVDVGMSFAAQVKVDTATGTVESFRYTIDGLSPWAGSGGLIGSSATGLEFDLNQFDANYSQRGLGSGALLSTFDLLDLSGPASAFGGFIDGFATTFDLAQMTKRGGSGSYCRSGFANLSVRLDEVTADVVGAATLPEPGTAALAGLAGLAALRSTRRRKTATA